MGTLLWLDGGPGKAFIVLMLDSLTRLEAALAERYTVQHELGREGMAVVYLADDLKHGTPPP